MNNTEDFPAVPFVIVIDRSGSMESNHGIDLINSTLPDLIKTLRDNPEIEETASLGILSFATHSRIERPILPLTTDEFEVNKFKADGTTSYAAPLRQLRSMLEQDLPKLAPRGRRPIVFFITDGKPNEEDHEVWVAARQTLLEPGFRLRPTLVVLGCGDVEQSCLEELASEPRLARSEDGPTREALKAILRTVRGTIITLTQEGNSRKDYVPDGPNDLVALIFDYDDFGTGDDEVFAYQPA